MTCYRWLHLTDLHLGMDEQDWLWPDARDIFLEDLRCLHNQCGPWDLVLFTGDLTYEGSVQQFKALDELLKELWEHLHEPGSDIPKLLAVPGNHDLVRPNKKDHLVQLFRDWNNASAVRKEFWTNERSSYRQMVAEAFENYVTWQEKQPFLVKGSTTGMLPGDFSVSIEKRGAKLGILGLNTAFLQLTDDDYQGKLALHTRQFHQVCGGDGPAWVKRHHVCLLMTHHPPAWLNQRARENHLNRHITSHGRFAVHLFGHMHTNAYRGTTRGAEARRIWQSRSLFGLRFFGERAERSFGYTAGKIELQGDKGMLTLWPRRDTLIDGQIEIVPDYSAGKLIDEHTKPIAFDLIQRYNVQNAQPEPNNSTPVVKLRVEKFEPTRLKQLLDLLDEHFNLEEFRTLCLTLGVKYDNLGGEGKINKFRELLTHLKRRGRLSELVSLVKTERPDVQWTSPTNIPSLVDVLKTPGTLFIPTGPFQLGNPLDDLTACRNEQPPRKLILSAYWIGRYPVTNQEYARFVLDTGHAPPEHWEGAEIPAGLQDHPVVNVNFEDAQAYCHWLGQLDGKLYRLPTEAEWEKAARGGWPETRRYPWGDEWQTNICNTRELGRDSTTSVHEFEQTNQSPFQVIDIAGNVWEWTTSWYDSYPGSLYKSPRYGQICRVVRGGSWRRPCKFARVSCRGRYEPHIKRPDLGFRIAAD